MVSGIQSIRTLICKSEDVQDIGCRQCKREPAASVVLVAMGRRVALSYDRICERSERCLGGNGWRAAGASAVLGALDVQSSTMVHQLC